MIDGKVSITFKNDGNPIIDEEKQKINQYLKSYEIIMSLLKDGMHHFNDCILDENFPESRKKIIVINKKYFFKLIIFNRLNYLLQLTNF